MIQLFIHDFPLHPGRGNSLGIDFQPFFHDFPIQAIAAISVGLGILLPAGTGTKTRNGHLVLNAFSDTHDLHRKFNGLEIWNSIPMYSMP